MAGSDIFANSASGTTINNATATLFAGPIRLKGFIIEPNVTTGTLTFIDGGTDVFEVTTGNVSAGASTVQLNLPAEGIKFGTSLQAKASVNGAISVTVFYA